MWDNTVWNEIEDVADAGYEVEKVTAVAGVRGAEAEDEALHHLYYRQSMKGPSKVELNKALGKLLNTLSSLKEKNPEHAKIPEVTHYVIQIYKKLITAEHYILQFTLHFKFYILHSFGLHYQII